MKALPKKLLPLTLSAIAVTSLFSVQPIQGLTITMKQVFSNVVATGSGAIDLTGLSFNGGGVSLGPGINPFIAFIVTGTGSGSAYEGFTGPTMFGAPLPTSPITSSGDYVGISGTTTLPLLFVPQGYVSNAALSNSMTFANATFASLRVTPGTYIWSWGTGLANQNFTLQIGPVPGPSVPDGGSTVSLLGSALVGLAVLRRKLSC